MEEQKLQQTQKSYYDDSYLFSLETKIIQKQNYEKDNQLTLILCEKTIFHPQGGGQPDDIGFISQNQNQYQVTGTVYDKQNELIWHIVKDGNNLQIGDVIMNIDEQKRKLYARLHSAGHLIEVVVQSLNLPWKVVKGFHFEGSYVEYNGEIGQNSKEQLEEKCNQIIKSLTIDDGVIAKIYDYEQGIKSLKVPSYVPQDKPFRFVKLFKDDVGLPCGGTHVKHLSELQKLTISKIQKKGKNLRVCYSAQKIIKYVL